MKTHSRILAWKILWTEKAGIYRPWSCEQSEITEHAQVYRKPRNQPANLWSINLSQRRQDYTVEKRYSLQ